MSISDIEAEARRIIDEAKRKADEIIREAKAKAEELDRKDVGKVLTREEVESIINEFKERFNKVMSEYMAHEKKIKENFSKWRDSIIDEFVRRILGVKT